MQTMLHQSISCCSGCATRTLSWISVMIMKHNTDIATKHCTVRIHFEAQKEISWNILVPPSLKSIVGNGDVIEWYQSRVPTLSLEWECTKIYDSMWWKLTTFGNNNCIQKFPYAILSYMYICCRLIVFNFILHIGCIKIIESPRKPPQI